MTNIPKISKKSHKSNFLEAVCGPMLLILGGEMPPDHSDVTCIFS